MPAEKETLKSLTNTEHDYYPIDGDLERMALLGKFTAKIAHELNNPLDGILRYVNLAMRSLEHNNTEKLPEYLNHCRDGLLRMTGIVSELLEYSRSHYALPEESIIISQIVDDAIKTISVRPDMPKIQITRSFARNLPKVKATSLFQVFCNLTKNAFDSMPGGGELRVSAQLEPDGVIVIQFTDTGCGFDPKDSETIFEPFFTTKQDGKGTGLGLAICKDIVSKYGGRITAKNNSDRGSTFTIYLSAERIKDS